MTNPTSPLFFMEESHTVPLVEIAMVTRSGSAIDPSGREGSLALALRSLRRGAGTRTAFAIDEEIDRLGAELGTSTDIGSTMIHATVIRRNLEPFLDLLSDIVLRPTFSAEEVGQVLRETRADIVESRDDDRALAGRWFRRTLFAGHLYGRPAAGLLSSLSTLDRSDAINMYGQTLRANNLVVGVSGDITQTEFEKLFNQRFSALPTGDAPVVELKELSKPKGRHLVIVDKPARTQTQIFIGSLGTHPHDPDHTALAVGNTIFGGTFTARLMKEVRSKRGWSYGASSRLSKDRIRESWTMWTFPAATDAPACIELQLQLLEDLLDKGVTKSELDFAKKYLSRSYAFEIDTAAKRLAQKIDENVLGLPKNYYRDYLKRIQAVTVEQVNAALRKRLSAKDLLITVVATASEIQPLLEKRIKNLASTRVIPFDSDVLPTSLG